MILTPELTPEKILRELKQLVLAEESLSIKFKVVNFLLVQGKL